MDSGKTMVELAVALRHEGIDVSHHYEAGSDYGLPVVVFRGDDGAGMRAVEVAWRYGYEPQGLVRDWTIWGRDISEPDWTLLFENEEPEQ